MADDPKPEPPKTTWIDSLAQRSTGLPADEKPSAKPAADGDKTLYKMAGLGIQFAVTVAVFAIIGREADKHFGWTPWGVISFTLIALVGSLYLLIKESVMGQDGPTPREKRKQM